MQANEELLRSIKYSSDGLVTVVVQDHKTAEVLMTAWANEEALKKTFETGELVLWSRSRKEIWHKGMTSGNRMKVVSMMIDCDGDTLLAIVEPMGPACHTGERSCFYRELATDGTKGTSTGTFLASLFRYLQKRADDDPEVSYTSRLLKSGRSRVAQKVGEEGVETALALATSDIDGFRYEGADLVYHLLVACIAAGIPFTDIVEELKSRHKPA